MSGLGNTPGDFYWRPLADISGGSSNNVNGTTYNQVLPIIVQVIGLFIINGDNYLVYQGPNITNQGMIDDFNTFIPTLPSNEQSNLNSQIGTGWTITAQQGYYLWLINPGT